MSPVEKILAKTPCGLSQPHHFWVYLMVRPANKNTATSGCPACVLPHLNLAHHGAKSEIGPCEFYSCGGFRNHGGTCKKSSILGFSHGFSHGISSHPAIIGVTPSSTKRSSCCSALFSSWSKLPQPEIQMVLGWVICSPLIVMTCYDYD